jgi:nicotinate-nucleotide adenylyltransferase
VADDAAELAALDRVVFVPAAAPPHKPAAELAAAEHRFAMTRLAVAEHPRFEVSDVELGRPGPSYTADTLAALAPRGDLVLLVGSETFLDLLAWREPRRVAQLAQLCVVPRAGSGFDPESPAAQKVLRELGLPPFAAVGEAGAAPAGAPLLVRATSLPVSASDLRRRAREGRSLAFRTPSAVAAYLRAHRLYGATG